jgi:uncharacterized protein (UPF0179 family)
VPPITGRFHVAFSVSLALIPLRKRVSGKLIQHQASCCETKKKDCSTNSKPHPKLSAVPDSWIARGYTRTATSIERASPPCPVNSNRIRRLDPRLFFL